MVTEILWVLAILLVAFVTYLVSYLRFRTLIASQTRQMIRLMKAEESEFAKINNVFEKTDQDFADLERAAMGLRKKYLRLKRQSLEERKGYETVFSGLKEAIVTVDSQLKIISFNAAFLATFKWAPVSTQTYFLQDVIRDPEIIKSFKRTFEQSSVQKYEGDIMQLFVTPLPSRVEDQTWCLGVFYDLTEIRKTEKIKVDFVANASHELRTPLTVIKGYSELLLKKFEKDQSVNELVKPILNSSDSMMELIDDLLNLSKLDLGTSIQKDVLSTQKVTQDVLKEVESVQIMKNKLIALDYQTSEVLANQDSIKQILRNLIINAIKYSGEAAKIEVAWSENPTMTVLKVKDYGPGIPKVQQDRIFERFYRIDKGRHRDQGGTGLGLALVKHQMMNHNGRISVHSEMGHGAEFICEFPKKDF